MPAKDKHTSPATSRPLSPLHRFIFPVPRFLFYLLKAITHTICSPENSRVLQKSLTKTLQLKTNKIKTPSKQNAMPSRPVLCTTGFSKFFVAHTFLIYQYQTIAPKLAKQLLERLPQKNLEYPALYLDRDGNGVFQGIHRQHPSDPVLANTQKMPFHHSGWMTEKELTCIHIPIFHIRLSWEVEACVYTHGSFQQNPWPHNSTKSFKNQRAP